MSTRWACSVAVGKLADEDGPMVWRELPAFILDSATGVLADDASQAEVVDVCNRIVDSADVFDAVSVAVVVVDDPVPGLGSCRYCRAVIRFDTMRGQWVDITTGTDCERSTVGHAP